MKNQSCSIILQVLLKAERTLIPSSEFLYVTTGLMLLPVTSRLDECCNHNTPFCHGSCWRQIAILYTDER